MGQNSSTNDSPREAEILEGLGQRMARKRLERNLTQDDLAKEAGVSRATVRRLEAGRSTQLANLIRILGALGLAQNFGSLVPETGMRPLEAVERKRKERKRASRPRSARPPEPSASKTNWVWDEDR